jgi:hypothetical protein
MPSAWTPLPSPTPPRAESPKPSLSSASSHVLQNPPLPHRPHPPHPPPRLLHPQRPARRRPRRAQRPAPRRERPPSSPTATTERVEVGVVARREGRRELPRQPPRRAARRDRPARQLRHKTLPLPQQVARVGRVGRVGRRHGRAVERTERDALRRQPRQWRRSEAWRREGRPELPARRVRAGERGLRRRLWRSWRGETCSAPHWTPGRRCTFSTRSSPPLTSGWGLRRQTLPRARCSRAWPPSTPGPRPTPVPSCRGSALFAGRRRRRSAPPRVPHRPRRTPSTSQLRRRPSRPTPRLAVRLSRVEERRGTRWRR